MNKGEYGNYIRINVGEDISASTNELRLLSPTSVSKVKLAGDGLVVGGVDFTDNNVDPPVTFLANEYVEYRTISTDIDEAGKWGARVFSQSADTLTCKTTDNRQFTVGE